MSAPRSAIEELRDVVARLRAPGGCPWDREQTHATLRGAVLEEAYEVVAAIDAGDDANLREELGDLLLQVVFHSQLAAEEQRFDLDDVSRGITQKLIRRHPHVFGDAHCADAAAVLNRWEQIKRDEAGQTAGSLIHGVSRGLPALLRAQKVQKKAAAVGFDWHTANAVVAKVREELKEVEAVIGNADKIEEEVGDLLFAIVNLGRKCGLDTEVALARATDKFATRFQRMERLAAERQLAFETLTLDQLDALWNEVKHLQAKEALPGRPPAGEGPS